MENQDGFQSCSKCGTQFRPDEQLTEGNCYRCQTKLNDFRKRRNERMSRSGVMPRHIQTGMVSLTDWCEGMPIEHHPQSKKVGDAVDAIMDQRLDMLAVVGPRGTGKTLLGSIVVQEAINQYDVPAHITTAWDLVCNLRAARSYSAPREVQLNARGAYENVRVLVIDEFQTRMDSRAEFAELTTLIDWRYGHMKSTIFLANLTPEGFAEVAGNSVVSRLTQVGGIVECTWPSFRGGNDQQR